MAGGVHDGPCWASRILVMTSPWPWRDVHVLSVPLFAVKISSAKSAWIDIEAISTRFCFTTISKARIPL